MNKKALFLASLALCILLISAAPAMASGSPDTVQGAGETGASALTGAWRGTDNLGNILVTTTTGNKITISHPGADLLPEEGAFTFDASTIFMTFEDGATQTYRYLLAGDTMLLTDEEFLFPVRLTRSSGGAMHSGAQMLIGTWSGDADGVYGEITFTAYGVLSVASYSAEDFSQTGSYTVDGNTIKASMKTGDEEITFAFSGESLILSEKEWNYTFTRQPGPLQRTVAEKETAGPGLDPIILGTFGGMEENLYVEWTFHGDGTFSRYVPQNDLMCYEGTYETKNGILSLYTPDAVLTGAYTAAEEVLGIHFSDDDSFGYTRKTGPLARAGSLNE